MWSCINVSVIFFLGFTLWLFESAYADLGRGVAYSRLRGSWSRPPSWGRWWQASCSTSGLQIEECSSESWHECLHCWFWTGFNICGWQGMWRRSRPSGNPKIYGTRSSRWRHQFYQGCILEDRYVCLRSCLMGDCFQVMPFVTSLANFTYAIICIK